MKRRVPKLGRWLAVTYLVWSLLVFFGSLGSESHNWWPIFLYPVIWPWGQIFMLISSAFADTVADYIEGALFIAGGGLWIWFLGRLFSILLTRLFPIQNEADLKAEADGGGGSV